MPFDAHLYDALRNLFDGQSATKILSLKFLFWFLLHAEILIVFEPSLELRTGILILILQAIL